MKTWLLSIITFFTDLLTKMQWASIQLMLGIMEILEYISSAFLGVGTTVDDYFNFTDKNGLTEMYVKTFRAICAVAVVLMIIFTIMAIVRQEIANATDPNGFSAKQNVKTPIIMQLFKGIMSIIIFPLAMIIIISGVNAALTSFRNAMRGDTQMTVAQSVLYSSSYDANKYRKYANSDKRVPAIVKAYDADAYMADEKDKLMEKIESTLVQNRLDETKDKLNNTDNCLTFKESLSFKNNKLINSSDYGDYYETYICTPEQYNTIADFTDYAQKSQAKFKIVPMDDKSIDWKYVNEAVYNKDDGSLTINYMDANDLNPDGETYSITYSMSYEVTSPISNAMDSLEAILGVSDYENLKYFEMERDPNSVNMVQWANEKASIHFSKNFQLNKQEDWTSTDEIILYEYYHFATNNTFSDYSLDDFAYKKAVDEGDPVILDVYKYVYREYYAEPDSYSPERTIYCVLINGNYYTVEKSQEERDVYGDYYYVLQEIEGVNFLETSYTTIYENTRERFTQAEKNKGDTSLYRVNYNALLKLSSGFKLNDKSTWTYTDEIIVYEYYKDLSYRNSLSKYSIADFVTGVRLPTYTIAQHRTLDHISGSAAAERPESETIDGLPANPAPKVCVLINDVYYEVKIRDDLTLSTSDTSNIKYKMAYNMAYTDPVTNQSVAKLGPDQIDEKGNPLYELVTPKVNNVLQEDALEVIQESTNAFFKYALNLNNDNYAKYFGISTKDSSNKTADDFIISNEANTDDADYFNDSKTYYYYDSEGVLKNTKDLGTAFVEDLSIDEYANFDLVFSSTFDYKDVKTWSYKDYFIFYLYSKYLAYSGNFALDQLRNENSLSGKIGKVGMKLDDGNTTITEYLYLFKIDESLTAYSKKPFVNNKPQLDNIVAYLKIADILQISEMNMARQFELDETLNVNDYDLTSSEELIINAAGDDYDYSLLHTETESKEFRFSDAFNGNGTGSNSFTRIEDWTIEDYLLLVLSEKGYINLSSYVGTNLFQADYSEYSYNAIVYKKPVDDFTNNKKYFTAEEFADGYIRFYCFGTGEKKIYINENYVTRKVEHGGLGYETFDKFLETNLMNFFKKNISTGEIISNAETISQSLYQMNDFSNYVFTGKTFIKELIKNYVYNTNTPMFKIYSDIVHYEYYNDRFIAEDLTTWTNLDFVLYYIDGLVNKKLYYFDLIQDASGNKYCKINDNYAISIESGSPLALSLSSSTAANRVETKYEITSSSAPVTNRADAEQYYVDNNFGSSVIEKAPEDLMQSSTVKYKYKFLADASSYTKLDVMLAGLQKEKNFTANKYESSRQCEFEVYNIKDYNERYIKVGESNGKYILLKIDGSDDALFNCQTKSMIIMETGKLFTALADQFYVPFEGIKDITDSASVPGGEINILDAIIYNYTNKAVYDENTKYQVYKFNGFSYNSNYIVVFTERTGMALIRHSDSDTTVYYNVGSKVGYTDGSESKQSKLLRNLYDNFYSKYIIDSKAMSGLLSGSIDVSLSLINFELAAPQNWTPLKILLYKAGLITDTDSAQQIPKDDDTNTVFKLRALADGSRYFFYVETTVGTELTKNYIDITEFVDIKLGSLDYAVATAEDIVKAIIEAKNTEDYVFAEKCTPIFGMFLKSMLMEEGKSVDQVIGGYTDLRTNSSITAAINGKKLADQKVLTSTDNVMTIYDTKTWTWFDVVYYYLFGRENTNTKYTVYYSNGESFIQVKSGLADGKSYYIKYDKSLADPLKSIKNGTYQFTAPTSQEIVFDIESGNISKLGIVYNKLMHLNKGTVLKYTIPGVASSNFYVIQSPDNNHQYIYGLSGTDSINSNSNNSITYQYDSAATIKNINEWSTLDLIIRSEFGNTGTQRDLYDGSILTIGDDVHYFSIAVGGLDKIYINLSALGFSTSATNPNKIGTTATLIDTDKGIEYRSITCGSKLIDLFGFDASNQTSYSYSNANQRKLLLNYSNASDLKVSRISDKFIKLYFSAKYNPDNESTWKFSDYILEYIFNSTKLNYDDSLASDFDYYVQLGYVPATIYSLRNADGTNEICYLIGDHKEEDISSADLSNYYFVSKATYTQYMEFNYQSVIGKYSSDMAKAFYSTTTNGVTKAGMDMAVQLKFSSNFDFSDASTWTLSDYLLYYIFEKSVNSSDSKYNYDQSITNFQYYVNQGYVPARVYYLNAFMEKEMGNLNEHKVMVIGTDEDIVIGVTYLDKNGVSHRETETYTYKEVSEKTALLSSITTEHMTKYGYTKVTGYKDGNGQLHEGTQTGYASIYIYKDSFGELHEGSELYTYIEEVTKTALLKDITDEHMREYGYEKVNNKDKYLFINYNLVYGLYSKPLYYTEYVDVDDGALPVQLNRFGQSIDVSTEQANNLFGVKFETKITSADLKFDNYYYFKDNKNFLDVWSQVKVPESKINQILSDQGGDGVNRYVNLKLSKGFRLDRPDGGDGSTPWTILDYIIIYEYSRNINNNAFYGLTYTDLKNSNLLVQLTGYILKINGNFYDLQAIKSTDDNATEVKIELALGDRDCDGDVEDANGIVSYVRIENPSNTGYSYRVLKESIKYNLKPSRDLITDKLFKDGKTLLYTGKVNISNSVTDPVIEESLPPMKDGYYAVIDLTTVSVQTTTGATLLKENVPISYYRKLDTNTYMHFQLSLTKYENYKISPLVKQVNWPQKLMNDMKVIYPNLNWSNLVATDGWIDTLGEYFSGTTSGQFIASGNSSNITAVGMVLSEFFLSVANKTEDVGAYADYTYESIFDEKTIQALMLSMLGEYEYNALVMEAKVFVDMFNTGFAAILDDVAAERGIIIKEGDTSNLAMSIYKSYLATAILSSDLGEYLYVIATRVYAQYTIYESFAKAKGVYADYYAYIHGESNADGNIVDAFAYASFKELVEHENKYLNDGDIPVFTFNMKSVMKKLYGSQLDGLDINKEIDYVFGRVAANQVELDKTFSDVIKDLNNYYRSIYISGDLAYSPKIASNQPYYCFMFDVYWQIKQQLTQRGAKDPVYLQLYYKYITGSIERWNAFDDVSISGSSVYIQHYNLYKAMLYLKQVKVTASMIGCYGIVYNKTESLDALTPEEQENLKSQIENKVNDFLDNFQSVPTVLKKVFETNDICAGYVDDLLPNTWTIILEILIDMTTSQNGNMRCWDKILTRQKQLETIVSELSLVLGLEEGEVTDMGSARNSLVTESALESVYDKVNNYYSAISDYINTQRIVDAVEKSSITFTLAQFGNNFIEDGYDFTIDNKQYHMNTSVSAQRLAEYVYGGAFLVPFGVQPTYTDENFEGIVEITTAYDQKTGLAKKKLDIFTTLRDFARKIADYTGKLYYLTNLNDVAERTNDSMILTDYVNVETPNLKIDASSVASMITTSSSWGADKQLFANGIMSSSHKYTKATMEYAMIDYIIGNKYLSYDTLYNLLVVDNEHSDTSGFKNLISNDYLLMMLYHNNFENQKINNVTYDVKDDYLEDLKNMALRRYLWLIQSDNYTKGVYLEDTENSSERMHSVFKKFILYISGYSDAETTIIDVEANPEKAKLLIDFKDLHFKDLKVKLMDALVNYVQYENSSGEENTNRYLTLFYLVAGEYNHFIKTVKDEKYTNDSTVPEKEIGRTIPSVNKETTDASGIVRYKSFDETYHMRVRFRVDSETKGMILNLAGIPNRPIEELVGLEYDELYDKNGCYDEADGDTFIYCTYDETTGKHFPVLATGKGFEDTDGKIESFEAVIDIYRNPKEYAEDVRIHGRNGVVFSTDYYDDQYAYPVIARGIVLPGGLSTAIRVENGEVIYYRDGVTYTGSIDEDSFKEATVVSEVTTVGYTSYVPISTFGSASGNSDNQQMMYNGANGNSIEVVSDGQAVYVQYRTEYDVATEDEYGQMNVYEDFETNYDLSLNDGNSVILLIFMQTMVVVPILFKVLLSAMRRVLDLMFLVLAGPLCISMNSLEFKVSGEGKIKPHRAYTDWMTKMTAALLSAFGLVVSFNLYGIIIGTALNMTYVTSGDPTMQIIEGNPVISVALSILLFGGDKTKFVNFIIKFFFVLVGSMMLQSAANLVGSIVTAGRVKKSFNSQLDNKDVFEEVTKLVKSASMGLVLIGQLYSGELLENAMHAALKKATDMIPGSAILKKGIHIAQNQKAKKKANDLAKKAQEKGVSKGVAEKMAKELYEEKKKQIAAKKQNHEKKAAAFSQSMQVVTDPNFRNKASDALDKHRQDKEKKAADAKQKSINRSTHKAKPQKSGKGKGKGKKGKKKSGDDSEEKK